MARDTIKVIVSRVAIIVLVNTPPIQFKTPQQPSFNELFQRPVNGWPTDVICIPFARKLIDQLIRIEVLMATKYLLHQEVLLLRFSQSTTKQVLFKSLNGRLRYFDRFK